MQEIPLCAKLYQYAACPFCHKVRVLLHYKQIPYETIEVHPINKKELEFSKDYRKVPIFVDANGKQVNDSTAIMKYIDEAYPNHPVFEKETKRIETEEKWLKWADEVLARALPPLIYQSLYSSWNSFSYISRVSKFGAFEKIWIQAFGSMIMFLVAKKSAKKQGIEDPEAHLQSVLRDWEAQLSERFSMSNERPNGADFAIFGVLKSVKPLAVFELIEQNSRVSKWYHEMEALLPVSHEQH